MVIKMEKMEISIKEEAMMEAKVLSIKLIWHPETFTLGELARLQELMEIEGLLDQEVPVISASLPI